MATMYLGLGSNIDAEARLRLAMRELRQRFQVLELSPVYRNPAVGFDGPEFLNLVVSIETRKSPETVIAEIDEIHALAGRERGGVRHSSRTLDIDLLLIDEPGIDQGPLELPRRDVLKYAFVLKPLADIAPDLVHPRSRCTIGDHWKQFDARRHPLTITDVIL